MASSKVDANILVAFTDAEFQFLSRMMKRVGPAWEVWGKSALGKSFLKWVESTVEKRELEHRDGEREQVKSILRNSERGNRTPEQRDILRKFCSKLQVFPKELTKEQLDILSNEVDYYPVQGQSIIFLQGDFGNVYYVIAVGEVALYLQASKDKEMHMAREFGHQRGLPYSYTCEEKFIKMATAEVRTNVLQRRQSRASEFSADQQMRKSSVSQDTQDMVDFMGLEPHFLDAMKKEELTKLGEHVVTLKAGYGFGEAAILSAKSKLRGATAFSNTDDTFLLVLHAETYNSVLRQVHYRQKQLAACTSLLLQLPLFKNYTYSKLSNIAYYMRSSSYSIGAMIKAARSPAEMVLVVCSGTVKQLRPESKLRPENETSAETLTRRLPGLASAILGRGSVIGEFEMHERIKEFRYTYIADSNDCEVFEMPASIYIEHACTKQLRETNVYKEFEVLRNVMDNAHKTRLDRAADAIKSLVVSDSAARDDRAELLTMLPLLVDGLDVDNTMSWDPAHQTNGLNYHINARGFKHEKASAMTFLKVPESPSPRPLVAEEPTGAVVKRTVSGKPVHFSSKLVQSEEEAPRDESEPRQPSTAKRSEAIRSPRTSRELMPKKKFRIPLSDRVKVMNFGKPISNKAPVGSINANP